MKKLLIVVVVLLAALAGAGAAIKRATSYDLPTLARSAPIGTGYAAKMLCSGVFVSGRTPESLWKEDLELMRNNMIDGSVDYEKKTADASILGFLYKRRAVFHGSCGCSLELEGGKKEVFDDCGPSLPAPTPADAKRQWPDGDANAGMSDFSKIDKKTLDAFMNWAFVEHNINRPARTRAVIVIYDGRIVAEKYADGFSKDTRLLGWSMTKSVTGAMAGILARQGRLNIGKPAAAPEWASSGDPRSGITIEHLLRMSDGLDFKEIYEDNPDNDAGYMFFTVPDMAAYAAAKQPIAKPGERFNYSSGSTMLLARIVKNAAGGSHADYLAFPRKELFDKIGMKSALIEQDPSGLMVGAGFMYATARDWARFGLLYMNDGVWNGERILPEGWVRLSAEPSPASADYGMQFWLNREQDGKKWWPDCPGDLYSAWGHEGQFVTIIPSRKTVIVRLGQTFDEERNWDRNYFTAGVLKALPE